MDCFGSDSEDENTDPISRDESCGILSFHPHTETSLLNHVKNSLLNSDYSTRPRAHNEINSQRPGLTKERKTKEEMVLKAVDEFCITRHWMMHVGPEKGDILKRLLRESIDKKIQLSSSSSQQSNHRFVLVELGAYCGYSSILMAIECLAAYADKNIDFKLITLEIHPEYIAIARELIKLSGLDNVISLLEVSFNGHTTDMVELLQSELRQIYSGENNHHRAIDFLFIDHDKDFYKSDLIRLENSGLIRSGTRVVADNVLFAKIYDYLEYVVEKQRDGVVRTNTLPCRVEYSDLELLSAGENCELLADGIGEFL
jgi:catechol O-methyltransferase